MMRYIRLSLAAVAALLLAVSCAREQSESYNKLEDLSLEAWMAQNKPELLGNRQGFGNASYYIEVLDAGDSGARPVNDTVCWVQFDFSGRDLASHEIIITRSARQAKLAGTFTKYTHYVPFYRYCGTGNTGLPEATYLAMRNEQTLGEDYVADFNRNNPGREIELPFLLREGARVALYCPSRVVGDLSSSGGYEGDFTLAASKPVRIEMTICDTVKNPLQAEGSAVDSYCRQQGGLRIYSSSKEAADGVVPLPTDPKDANHPYRVAERWVSACDSLPQLYVDYRYTPARQLVFPEPYAVGVEPYASEASMALVDQQINEALRKRFLDDDAADFPDAVTLDADSVGMEGKAKIWYITRFLDGFILDTNIDEVKQIVYGEVKTAGEAFEYTPEKGGAVQAWYYTVPKLKYGQWAAIVTVSTHAYGAQGRQGSTQSSSSGSGYSQSYSDYLNLLNYANAYYGNGYGGYFPGYYGNYLGGMYGGYGSYMGGIGSGDGDQSETTTTVITEVLPFTPLVFQIYVEPAE